MKNNKETFKSVYVVFLVTISLGLIFIHGIGWKSFTVDNTTILLLLILMVPILSKYVESIKFGGLEASFKELSKSDRELFLINELAKEEKWTFYEARGSETHSGEALLWLTKKLKKDFPEKFQNMLTEQLASDDDNLVWFASEVIGYFKIEHFQEHLRKHVQKMKLKNKIATYKLNCLWALSRFNNYQELFDQLDSETHPSNQDWIVEALIQMISVHLDRYLKRKEVSELDILHQLRERSSKISNTGSISVELKNELEAVAKSIPDQ